MVLDGKAEGVKRETLEGHILVSDSTRVVPADVSNKLITSRLCIYGEVDMHEARLNVRLLNLLTSGGVVSFAGYAEFGMQARTTDKEYMKFIYESIAERIKSPTPPLSPQTVLYTLLADKIPEILKYVVPDYTSSYTECLLATNLR